ncbi:hypothetical protein FOZ63_020208, partial [Perkinsus olseni]
QRVQIDKEVTALQRRIREMVAATMEAAAAATGGGPTAAQPPATESEDGSLTLLMEGFSDRIENGCFTVEEQTCRFVPVIFGAYERKLSGLLRDIKGGSMGAHCASGESQETASSSSSTPPQEPEAATAAAAAAAPKPTHHVTANPHLN